MERLTQRTGSGVGYIGRHSRLAAVPGLCDTAETMKVAAIREALARLADYEDTGLEPGQILSACKK